MLKRFLQSFGLAFQNIRSNFFHTFLSVLGVIIGVGALVSILSLIDGMEKYAREQINSTTDLNAISVSTNSFKTVNGIRLRKDSITYFKKEDVLAVRSRLSKPAKSYLYYRAAGEIQLEGDTIQSAVHGIGVVGLRVDSVIAGVMLEDHVWLEAKPSVVITHALAELLSPGRPAASLLHRKLKFGNYLLVIEAVVSIKNVKDPELFYPFGLLSAQELESNPPQLVIEAENVVDVQLLKEDLEKYLSNAFSTQQDFSVSTNQFRVEQAARGIALFRIIMGLIVGISVVVGGVGVMNVLLISVTERTAEIGIRKAMGATRKDIAMLFLSESIAVSTFGSLLGTIFGILFTMAAVPIVKIVIKIPFQAEYTPNTLLLISVLAVIVGVVFGTYPALRASRLNPVEAIRHE